MIKFSRGENLGGKASYMVHNGTNFSGLIRYFNAKDVAQCGDHCSVGWAFLNSNGRTDFFDTLAEAKDEAFKL